MDLLEAVLSGARFLASRHKSLDVMPVQATGYKTQVRWLPTSMLETWSSEIYFFPLKQGLSITALSEIIRADFEARQYYVTGRLTKAVYAGMLHEDNPPARLC